MLDDAALHGFASRLFKRVDSRKIDEFRDLVDLEIAKLSVEQNFSRPQAYRAIADELGLDIHLQKIPIFGWLGVGTGINSLDKLAKFESSSASRDERTNQVVNAILLALDGAIIVGSTAEEVVQAFIVRCLDRSADIFSIEKVMESEEEAGVWQEVFNTVGKFAGSSSAKNDDPLSDEQYLFETDEEFAKRCRAKAAIFDVLRSQSVQ